MSAVVIVQRLVEASPALMASLSAVMYAINVAVGIFSAFAAPRTTAIAAQVPSFRLGFATEILSIAAYAAIIPIFYDLFRPVSKVISLVAALAGAAANAVLAVSSLHVFAPLLLLAGAQWLNPFTSDQLAGVAAAFARLHGGPAFEVSVALFGVYSLLIGYLIFRSAFLPRALALLMVIAAIGWILAPGVLGGVSLALWLLVIGVNVSTRRSFEGE